LLAQPDSTVAKANAVANIANLFIVIPIISWRLNAGRG